MLRLNAYLGCHTALAVSAPEGWSLLRDPATSGLFAEAASVIEAATSEALAHDSTGREWINSVQWRLRIPEEAIRVREWLAIVRQRIRVTPNYLSGINWSWVDEIIRLYLLVPFVGEPDGVYTLLLRAIEDRDSESVELRAAFEPLVVGKDFPAVISFLIEEFGPEAIAFVRFFLTAENILLLKLAPNLTAAMSNRISGIEECLRRFRFGTLMSEDQYRNEARSLTAALLLVNVHMGQFEVPWGMFKSQVSEREGDTYDAFVAFRSLGSDSQSVGRNRVVTPHQYGNGRVVRYSFEARYWPQIFLAISIVEAFLEHPSFGLEAILSTRFRHDTLRREFVAAGAGVRDAFIVGAGPEVKERITEQLGAPVYRRVQGWANDLLRTKTGPSDAVLFDLVPTQEDVEKLLEVTSMSVDFEQFIDGIVDWMKKRLEEQVADARLRFSEELLPELRQIVARERAILMEDSSFRNQDVTKVAAAFESSIARAGQSLADWFLTQGFSNPSPLRFGDIEVAASGVFESHSIAGELDIRLLQGGLSEKLVPPERVKVCFDLLLEAFQNAHKHRHVKKGSIRLSNWIDGEMSGVLFSSSIVYSPKVYEREVVGEPFESIPDALFREGNSGLQKMASMAATVAGCSVAMKVFRRCRSFHVAVPLWRGM